jgi:hypothetical protein
MPRRRHAAGTTTGTFRQVTTCAVKLSVPCCSVCPPASLPDDERRVGRERRLRPVEILHLHERRESCSRHRASPGVDRRRTASRRRAARENHFDEPVANGAHGQVTTLAQRAAVRSPLRKRTPARVVRSPPMLPTVPRARRWRRRWRAGPRLHPAPPDQRGDRSRACAERHRITPSLSPSLPWRRSSRHGRAPGRRLPARRRSVHCAASRESTHMTGANIDVDGGSDFAEARRAMDARSISPAHGRVAVGDWRRRRDRAADREGLRPRVASRS